MARSDTNGLADERYSLLYLSKSSRGDGTQIIARMFALLCDPEIEEKMVRASLFCQALPLVGPPARDECYALEPALALGGPGTGGHDFGA